MARRTRAMNSDGTGLPNRHKCYDQDNLPEQPTGTLTQITTGCMQASNRNAERETQKRTQREPYIRAENQPKTNRQITSDNVYYVRLRVGFLLGIERFDGFWVSSAKALRHRSGCDSPRPSSTDRVTICQDPPSPVGLRFAKTRRDRSSCEAEKLCQPKTSRNPQISFYLILSP